MANRCKATEGAQQCLKARHPKIKGHTMGKKGATKEWMADGTPRPSRPSIARAIAEGRQVAKEATDRLPPVVDPDADTDVLRAVAGWFDAKQPALPRPGDGFMAGYGESRVKAAYDTTAFLVDLAVQQFDDEVARFQVASARLQDEVLERSRYMVFAAAAQARGHDPISAYCYIADRLDPAGVAP